MNVLVIEDDPVIRKSLAQGLDEAGYVCRAARDGEQGLEMATEQRPDLVILDVLLPGLSGVEVLTRLREAGYQMPVIMLTALGAVQDRIDGLTHGADDYVVKPFSFLELMARIQAVTRRSMNKPANVLEVSGITLDLTTRRVTSHDLVVDLTPTEFSILEMLMRFDGQVVTRQMLCDHIWGFRWDGNTNVIEVHINRLRQKLDGDGPVSCIQTVRGRGYALRPTV
jgi:two-component system OmpR family response regulator/two-component system copper resistance phosphate regulon response regulator CusR